MDIVIIRMPFPCVFAGEPLFQQPAKTIAKEYGATGITCNEICPGPIESELMDRVAAGREKDSGIPREKYLGNLRELIPDQRFATPLEIAELSLYLSSDYARHINGASIPIDGGYIA